VHLRPKKSKQHLTQLKLKKLKCYHKTTPRGRIVCILYYSNPTTSSTTNYLPISEIQQKTTITKSMDDGKVYAFCIQCHQANGKGDGINFPLDGSNWLTEKRTQSIHALKFD
jgi:hypothetical protein